MADDQYAIWLIEIDVITFKILGNEYKLRKSTLNCCNTDCEDASIIIYVGSVESVSTIMHLTNFWKN